MNGIEILYVSRCEINTWMEKIIRRLHESSRGARFRPGFESSSKSLELRSASRRAVSWR